MITTAAPRSARPRRSTLVRQTAERLAETEYQRFHAVLSGLTAEQWTLPTACVGWDVRAVAAHCLGMAEMAASRQESLRQNVIALRRGGRHGERFLDALTGLQVAERVAMTPDEIVDRFAVVAPRAARTRARTPTPMRRMRLPIKEPFRGDPTWTQGYLVETILTRDLWMHRVDITDATGARMELTADHDGVLVADVAVEWAARHDTPCVVSLSGPAGGRWRFAEGGPELAYDAVDFCRRVSGRGSAEGLLATQVPF